MIAVLHADPRVIATYYVDSDLGKGLTAINKLFIKFADRGPVGTSSWYGWLCESASNIYWMRKLAWSLNVEYVRRTDKPNHRASFSIDDNFDTIRKEHVAHFSADMTAWPQELLPRRYHYPTSGREAVNERVGDAHPVIHAFRSWYLDNTKDETWTARKKPEWWK